jgi:hypothetical protein
MREGRLGWASGANRGTSNAASALTLPTTSRSSSNGASGKACQSKKKAGVVEHPRVFDHAGLLFDGPPQHGRVALRLVIRQHQFNSLSEPTWNSPGLASWISLFRPATEKAIGKPLEGLLALLDEADPSNEK